MSSQSRQKTNYAWAFPVLQSKKVTPGPDITMGTWKFSMRGVRTFCKSHGQFRDCYVVPDIFTQQNGSSSDRVCHRIPDVMINRTVDGGDGGSYNLQIYTIGQAHKLN